MKKQFPLTLFTLFGTASGMALALVSCGKHSGPASPALRFYQGTAGHQVWSWEWNVSGSKFAAQDQTRQTKISGKLEYLPSGFYLATVQETNQAVTFPKGYRFHILEAPGVGLWARPENDPSQPIHTAASASDCTRSLGSYLWIRTGFIPTTSILSQDAAYGSLTLEPGASTSHASATLQGFHLNNGTVLNTSLASEDCQDGRMTFGTLSLQSAGGAGVFSMNLGSEGGIFGVKASSLSLDQLLGKSYLGILSSTHPTSHSTQPIRFQFNTALGTGYPFADLSTGLLHSDPTQTYTLHILDIQADHRVRATLTHSTLSRTLTGIAFQKESVTGIFLIGQELNGSGPLNLLLISQL